MYPNPDDTHQNGIKEKEIGDPDSSVAKPEKPVEKKQELPTVPIREQLARVVEQPAGHVSRVPSDHRTPALDLKSTSFSELLEITCRMQPGTSLFEQLFQKISAMVSNESDKAFLWLLSAIKGGNTTYISRVYSELQRMFFENKMQLRAIYMFYEKHKNDAPTS